MLDIIRRKQKSPAIRVVFWAIILAFVAGAYFLYVGTDTQGQRGGNQTALVINGQPIGMDAYRDSYRTLYNLYSSIYGQSFTPQLEKQLRLREQAAERLVNEYLLLMEAEKLGLSVSKDDLVSSIAANPAFHEGGTFNRDLYIRRLSAQRITVKSYESQVERQLLVDKVAETLTAGLTVTDEDITNAFKNDNDKIELQFVQLLPQLYESEVTIDADKLETFFQENVENFRLDEKVAIRYIQFDPSQYEDQVGTFSQEELKKFYGRNLDLFEIQEQVRASHILVRVPADADEAVKQEKRALIDSYLAEINAGKDFGTLAQTVSDDPGSAAKGGDLGRFPRGAMVGPFENAAFSLEPGSVSDVVETPFGFHLIKVTEKVEGGVMPLEDAEVIAQVKRGLTAEKSQKIAFEKAMDAFNINRKAGDLDAAAQNNNLTIKETALFAREDAIEGIGQAPEIVAAAFSLEPGELARPVEMPTGVFLIAQKEKQASRLPELTEVQNQVEKAYRADRAVALTEDKASDLLKQIQAGKALEALATEKNLTLETTGLFSRSYGTFVPRLGNAPELAEAAFMLTPAAPAAPKVFTLNNKQIVMVLKDQQAADLSQLDDTKKDSLKQRLQNEKQQALLEEKVKALRDATEVLIDPSLQDFIDSE